MHAITKTVLMIGLAGSLGGCQILNLPSLVFKSRPKAEANDWALAAKTDHTAALAEGRLALSAGNLSEAAALFRIAQGSEATYADATNGIAVAYAKLGKPDIAERYFRLAMNSQPENPKFAANLFRLQREVMAENQRQLQTRMAAAEAAVRASSSRQADAMPSDGTRVVKTGNSVRATRGMVYISTPTELAAAPAMTVESRDVKVVVEAKDEQADELTSDAKHVAIAKPQERAVYPIRLELD